MNNDEKERIIEELKLKTLLVPCGIADNLWKEALALVEELQTENTTLHKRLENTVEFPFKVGDTIYSLDHFDLKIRENKVIAITFLLSNSVNHLEVQAHKFRGAVASFESIDFGKDVFTDRSAAEARLAELKGEGDYRG